MIRTVLPLTDPAKSHHETTWSRQNRGYAKAHVFSPTGKHAKSMLGKSLSRSLALSFSIFLPLNMMPCQCDSVGGAFLTNPEIGILLSA